MATEQQRQPGVAHPAPFDLEAHHAGEETPGVVDHVARCGPCQTYLAELDAEAARFAALALAPDEFVRKVQRRAERGGGAQPAVTSTPARAALPAVVPAPGAGDGLAGRLVRSARALGAACAVAVVCVAGSWLVDGRMVRSVAAPADLVQMRGPEGAAPQMAVILLRDGEQTRVVAPLVEGRPGDRIRIELTVAMPGELEVVMLDDGRAGAGAAGAEVVVPAQSFGAGRQILAPTFAFDGEPRAVRVVAGPPASVRRVAAGGSAGPEVAVVSLSSAGSRP